jgi:hypothetical protein
LKKYNITILHLRELGKYPPILNFLSYAAKQDVKINCITGKFYSKNRLLNVFDYLIFTIRSFFVLFFSKNQNILYYESISAIPIFCYFKVLPFSKKKIYIHYHEYFNKGEYDQQSFFERLGRKLEVKIFKRAVWISHTNKHRLDLFHEEFPRIEKHILKELPNYPPSSWLKAPKQGFKETGNTKKLVHIGALSAKGMYLQNILEFVGNDPKFSIDFYSHNFTTEISELLSKYTNCQIKGSIAYEDIPTLKGKYDIGLVLYNGSSLNFIYNAPNKIFEYLALDLDVWCSDKLITARDHERLNCYPKMIMVDFENLKDFDEEKALNKEGLKYIPSPYFCEAVYQKLLQELKK